MTREIGHALDYNGACQIGETLSCTTIWKNKPQETWITVTRVHDSSIKPHPQELLEQQITHIIRDDLTTTNTMTDKALNAINHTTRLHSMNDQ